MVYSDWITPTPQPQLTFLLNFFMPGCGLIVASYFGKGGVNHKTLTLGLFHLIVDLLCNLHNKGANVAVL
jgi:hypothetical protein